VLTKAGSRVDTIHNHPNCVKVIEALIKVFGSANNIEIAAHLHANSHYLVNSKGQQTGRKC